MKPEPGAPHIVLSIMQGCKPEDSRSVTLEFGDCTPVHIDLPPSQFRILYLLVRSMLLDDRDRVAEHLRGFRATTVLARMYKILVNHHVPPNTQYITSQIMLIRRAFEAGLSLLESQNEITFERDFDIIVNQRGFGYRIGDFSCSIHDLNDTATPDNCVRD